LAWRRIGGSLFPEEPVTNRSLALLAVLLTVGGVVASPQPQTRVTAAKDMTPDPKWLRAELSRVREKRNLPAVAACVVYGDRVMVASAVGVRKWGDDTPATRDDRFHIGSIAKPMTATLVGILADQKKVRLDTTLEKMFPELRADMRAEYRAVTLSQLLGHVSGMPYQPKTSERDTDARGDTLADKRYEYVKAAVRDEPEVPPGTRFVYGGGSVIAASYLERAARQPFEELLAQHLFKKLKMTSAAFGSTATPPDEVDGPWEHEVVDGKPKPAPPDAAQSAQVRAPTGRNVVCTVGDLGRFSAATLQAPGVPEAGATSDAEVGCRDFHGRAPRPPHSGVGVRRAGRVGARPGALALRVEHAELRPRPRRPWGELCHLRDDERRQQGRRSRVRRTEPVPGRARPQGRGRGPQVSVRAPRTSALDARARYRLSPRT
jgi:CubicO group peptidase (beta-lactamase class C family)